MEKCVICGGSREEHAGRQHAFTLQEGDLRTPKAEPARPQVVRLGGAATNEAQAMNRMIEVLLSKGAISAGEALYVATGVRSEGIPAIIHTDGSMTIG